MKRNAGYSRRALGLLCWCGLMELRGEMLASLPAESLLNELAGFTARCTGETLGLDSRLTGGRYDDLDGHAAPPTLIVSLMLPSASCCSVQVWPLRRLSSFALSTAYA